MKFIKRRILELLNYTTIFALAAIAGYMYAELL